MAFKKKIKKPAIKPAKSKLSCKQKKAFDSSDSLFKFRRLDKVEGGVRKKAKHPKLIVDVKRRKFGYMGLTESKKRGHHFNLPLSKNPQKGQPDLVDGNPAAYLRKELRYASKDLFTEVLPNYYLYPEDKKEVIAFLEEIKKK